MKQPRCRPAPCLRLARATGLLLGLGDLAACAGDGVLDLVTAPGVTLTELQNEVFTTRCAIPNCHAGANPPQGMNLSAGQTHANVVNVPSNELPQYLRIHPGNPTDSYLYMKITGDPRIGGSPMPLTGGPLAADQIEAIRQWIEDGALDD